MYRSRLGDNLSKITLDYVSSLHSDAEIKLYDILGSQAHVLMLYEEGILARHEAKKILAALESLKDEELDTAHRAEDIHELVESLVIKKAGRASGGKMHTARSRNDQVSLDMRMKIRDDISLACNCLLDMIEALISVAQSHQSTVMPLYTHLQQAQAGLFSHYLIAHADALFRDMDRLLSAFKRVNQNPLGAGPVGGTSIAINRETTTSLLGFDGVVENSLDATSTRDFVAEYVSMSAILMTNLSKIAEDFVIWSSSEFSFIELADEFASPSSVMPQKKNPDILELTRAKTAEVIGNLTAVLVTIKGLASGYGRDLQQTKPAVWSTSSICISTILILKSVILTVRVNEKRMKEAAESGYLAALDVAEELVQNKMPFRTAHQVAGKLVQHAYGKKMRLSKLTLPDVLESVKTTGADPELVLGIIKGATASSSLRKRKSLGSSGYEEQERMLGGRKKKINSYREAAAKLDNRISRSLDNLESRVRDLIE